MIFVPGGVEDIDWSRYTSWLLSEPVRSSICSLYDQNKHYFMKRNDWLAVKMSPKESAHGNQQVVSKSVAQ